MIDFYHGPMGSGKSSKLIQDVATFGRVPRTPGARKTPINRVVVWTAGDRVGGKVAARSGQSVHAEPVPAADALHLSVEDLLDRMSSDQNRLVILVDEAQFMRGDQVSALVKAVLEHTDIRVRGYGLLTDFRGELFHGTLRWLEEADTIVQMIGIVPCKLCKRPGTRNMRLVGGTPTFDGPLKLIDNDPRRVTYQVVCARCFHAASVKWFNRQYERMTG